MSNALCPRRMSHSFSAVGISDEGVDGSPQTLSARLWAESQDLAAAALESDFVQGIKNGSLDPNHYGQYTVQDAVYCHRGVEGWRSIASRATQPDFKTFAEARVKGFRSAGKQTLID